MATVGIDSLLNAFERELLLKSAILKLKPYAVEDLLEMLKGGVETGFMQSDHRLDD